MHVKAGKKIENKLDKFGISVNNKTSNSLSERKAYGDYFCCCNASTGSGTLKKIK